MEHVQGYCAVLQNGICEVFTGEGESGCELEQHSMGKNKRRGEMGGLGGEEGVMVVGTHGELIFQNCWGFVNPCKLCSISPHAFVCGVVALKIAQW